MVDERPSPEAMLVRAADEQRRARRGRLKVYLGMAPGVGKTYEMLKEAQGRRRAGEDVVIGWVEPHGRPETQALTAGLERLPVRRALRGGLELQDFDLDAALARRPGLLLLDELAHTNAPGARHARRWNDVLELLDAGISVLSTLNVQHLESLNDVVAQVTGVVVRETVPDSVLEEASEIEVVDLPPDDLIQRLREGKVYVPQQVERALGGFFRRGNLIALRELALRRAAERVDAQMTDYRREHGIERAWPTGERLLVAVSPAPASANLVRAAARMAQRLRAPWLAVSVELPGFEQLPSTVRERLSSHLALAERLGAETVVVKGEDVAALLLAVARERNVTRIVIGKPPRGRWPSRFTRTLVERLVVQSGGIDVLVTTGDDEPGTARPDRPPRPPAAPWRAWVEALLFVAAPTALGWPLRGTLELADQAMLYLLAILLASLRLPRGPSLAGALVSVLALNFFFVPPVLSFTVADGRYLISFAVLLAVGVTVNALTGRVRRQAERAALREQRTAALYALSRRLALAADADGVAGALAEHASSLAQVPCVVWLAGAGGSMTLRAGAAVPLAQDASEQAVARWALEHGRPAGRGTDTLPASRALHLPLQGAGVPLGVLALALAEGTKALSPSARQMLDTITAQAGLALERAVLAEHAERARVAAETERTRSALLAGVSHDLRTPLTGIAGAAEALLDGAQALPASARQELLLTIRDDAERLRRLVEDLLDLTRLDSGAMAARKEWHPLEEVVAAALRSTEAALAGREVRVDLGPGLLLVPADPVLLTQVLVNLLENAAKYTPPGSPVDLRARRGGEAVTLEVEDRGPGFRPGDEQRLFEKFYRGPDAQRAVGSGLGLALCRAIVEAHGGAITASNRPGGGATFRFTLPLQGAPPEPSPEEPGA